MIIGTCNTPSIYSFKNNPSEVLAFPIVPMQLHFHLLKNWHYDSFTCRYILEACAKPNNRGICPAVGEDISTRIFLLC
jgi:hypothetical protein